MKDIVLKKYDYSKNEFEEIGKVGVSTLARSIDTEDFSSLMQEFLNVGMKDYREGERVGTLCQRAHRTIQGSIVRFCLGVLVALGKQEYTDARNETPVALCKQVTKMLEDGSLNMGYMI